MSNLSIKLNLTQLKFARRMMNGKNGQVDCLVIPIKDNNLFIGEKGIYLDITGFEIKKQGESKDTHLLKQSLPKDVYESLSEDQKKAIPIIGNARLWGTEHSDPEPQGDMTAGAEDSDLPF